VDFTSPWTILAVGIALLAATVIPGLYLWWPSRSGELAKSDLGLALMTGALIAFSVLVLEFMLTQRARKLESQRQDEAEQQALQLLVGRQQNLAGIDLGCSVAEDGSDCKALDDFYLSGKVLTDANLRGASLRGARLQRAHMEDAILAGADLRGSNLERAFLQRAVLDRAQLEGATLRFANLEGASLRGTHLQGADLNFAIVRADLEGAQLMGAQLFGVDLQNANLRSAKLQRADLRSSTLRDANLAGADLRKAKVEGVEFAHARYDANTKWPFPSRRRWPKCTRARCFVKPVRGRERARREEEREVALLRTEFERCLPDGWAVSPRDPAGFELTYPIHGARFFGERRPIEPGSPPEAFAIEARDRVKSTFHGYHATSFWPVPLASGRRALPLAGGRVWLHRFEYQAKGPQGNGVATWERLELYGVTADASYRFAGEAPADVFMLFARDFGELYSTLGVAPRAGFPSLADVRTCRGDPRTGRAGGVK
jgi:uncharacterized protein YjbI with pentapeptide repeats